MKGGTSILAVRCSEAFRTKLDKWRRAQPDAPAPAIAIRRLAERALASTSTRQRSRGSKRKAANLAEKAIDVLGDQAATGEQRAQRKRHLIKGPREFRDLRRDKSKTKGLP